MGLAAGFRADFAADFDLVFFHALLHALLLLPFPLLRPLLSSNLLLCQWRKGEHLNMRFATTTARAFLPTGVLKVVHLLDDCAIRAWALDYLVLNDFWLAA